MKTTKAKCPDCGKAREIFRGGRCFECYQKYLDELADKGGIGRKAANLWRGLK